MANRYRRVNLVAGAWSLTDAAVLDTPATRFVGLRRSVLQAAVLRTRSVHTFWLKDAIWVVDVSDSGRVMRLRLVPPRRMLLGGPCILELEAQIEPPPVNSVLSLVPSSGDVWNPRDLRNSDRESR